MSDTESAANNAGQRGAGSSVQAGQKKPRSPRERAIVWGLIAVLLVLVGIEGRASLGFRHAYDQLQKKLDESEMSNSAVTESDVKTLVTGYTGEPVSNEQLDVNEFNASREDIYSYSGLIKKHKLYVYYGVKLPDKEREVIRVSMEKAGPPPYEPFDLPPADMRLGPPGTNSRNGDAPADASSADGETPPSETPEASPVEAESTDATTPES